MTLTGGPGPDHHGGGSIRVDPHQTGAIEGGGQPVVGPREPDLGENRGSEPADLDVRAHADADQPAFGPGLVPAPLHPLVIGDLPKACGGGCIVTRVEREPAAHRGRELVGPPEVLLAHLDGVHPDLTGVGIDDALQVVDRLGATGAAVGIRGHRVGDHTVHLPSDRHLVLARCDPQAEKGDGHREVLGVGPHVGQRVELVPEELTVPGPHQGGGADPAAAMDRGPGRFSPGLRPLHGPAELPRRPSRQDLVVVDVEFGAEAAAHLGSNHAHVALVHPQLGGDGSPEGMRDLARRVDGEPAVARLVLGEDRPGLDRHGDQPLVGHLHGDHHGVVPFHRGVHLGCQVLESEGLPVAVVGPGVDHVRVQLGVDHVFVRRRLLQIDDGGKDVEIDLDGVDCVLGQVTVLGHHHGDGLPDVVDLTGREQGPELPDGHLGDERAEMGYVVVRVDGDDPFHALSRAGVQTRDLGPGNR